MCERENAPVLVLWWSLEKSPDLWWGLGTLMRMDCMKGEHIERADPLRWIITERGIWENRVTPSFTHLEFKSLKTRCQEDECPFQHSRGRFLFGFWFDFCLSGPLGLLAIPSGLLPCQHLTLFTVSSFGWADHLYWIHSLLQYDLPFNHHVSKHSHTLTFKKAHTHHSSRLKLFHKGKKWTERQFSVVCHFHNN